MAERRNPEHDRDALPLMPDRIFPESPRPLLPRPAQVELVVPRRPLLPILELLGISIHDVVNERRHRRTVRDLYRIARRIEDEGWLRRQIERQRDETWIDARI